MVHNFSIDMVSVQNMWRHVANNVNLKRPMRKAVFGFSRVQRCHLANGMEIFNFAWLLHKRNDDVECCSVGWYDRTSVVPQCHEYRRTSVQYLQTNTCSHFSKDFRAINQFIDRVNKVEIFKLHIMYMIFWCNSCVTALLPS